MTSASSLSWSLRALVGGGCAGYPVGARAGDSLLDRSPKSVGPSDDDGGVQHSVICLCFGITS